MKNDGLLLGQLGVWTIDGKVFVKTSPDGNPIKISQTLITFDSMLTYCWYETLKYGRGVSKGFESSGFFSKVFSLPGRIVVFFLRVFVRSGFCANLV